MTKLDDHDRALIRRILAPFVHRYEPLSPRELDESIVPVHGNSNYPLRVERGLLTGHDWLLAFGRVEREGEEPTEVYVTTDHVRASEMRGDAIDDAEAFVVLRNMLPRLLATLGSM